MGDKNYYLFLIKEVEEKKVKYFTVKDDDVDSGMFVAMVNGFFITVDGTVAYLLI